MAAPPSTIWPTIALMVLGLPCCPAGAQVVILPTAWVQGQASSYMSLGSAQVWSSGLACAFQGVRDAAGAQGTSLRQLEGALCLPAV